MTVAVAITAGLLAVSALLCLARLLRRGSLVNRILAMDVLILLGVGGVATHATATGSGIYLDVLVLAALIGFVGTVAYATILIAPDESGQGDGP